MTFYISMVVCFFWELHFACRFHLNPQEMENSLQFFKSVCKCSFSISSLLALLQLLGRVLAAVETNWLLKALSELKCHACTCSFSSQRTNNSQHNVFGSWRGNVGHCRLTSCYVFSAGMQGWTMVLLPLSHFSQRSNTALPTEKLLFHRGIPCLGREWLECILSRRRLSAQEVTLFKSNSLTLCSEGSEVMKGSFQILIKRCC